MAEPRVAHWLRPTSTTRLPRRLVCLDSEAVQTKTAGGAEQTFRLAVASFDLLDTESRPGPRTLWLETKDETELWQWIADRTAVGARTVVYAHNLGYDLRLTRGLDLLPALGFELRGLALTAYSAWARFVLGRRTLVLTDSSSWVHASQATIAQELRRSYVRLPPWNAGDAAWARRCRSDVETLRALVLRLFTLVRGHECGDWRLTGAAQGAAAFRRRFLKPQTLLVHDDQAALDQERRAAWAGRCELWQHGRVDELVHEIDFEAHYCTIAAREQVPGRLLGEKAPLPAHRFAGLAADVAILSPGVATTEQPTVPAELDGAIVWPVGTFQTCLWENEVALLESEGGLFEPSWHWLYERSDALQAWAAWVLAGLAGAPPGDEPIGRAVLKGWSRSLIGRFGLRYQDLSEIARADRTDLSLYPVRISATGESATWLHVGRQLFERAGLAETRDSLPQITSWVMAQARCELWAAMRAVGLAELLYVDTDGFLVRAPPGAATRLQTRLSGFPGLRLKTTWQGATLRGPRNLDVGEERRIAGIPRKAAQVGPATFEYEAWETLPGALRRSRADRVVVTERQTTTTGHDPRRRHLAGGSTEPLRLAFVDGVNVLDV